MENNQNENRVTHKTVKCPFCKHEVSFEPETKNLRCSYCQEVVEFEPVKSTINEINYEETLKKIQDELVYLKQKGIKCDHCLAIVTINYKGNLNYCPFCGSILTIKKEVEQEIVQPQALIPFKISEGDAYANFEYWLKKLWFAPFRLKKKFRVTHKLKGIYIPYFTFDSQTSTHYTGQRGDNYTTTETYHTTDANGKSVMRTRTVTRTRWTHTSGQVSYFIDDKLVLAATSLPKQNILLLEPWDLKELVPYDAHYLEGYQSENYQLTLNDALIRAKEKMKLDVKNVIKKDIGGDKQRVHNMDISYKNITFKPVMLPIWMSAYKYKEKTYRYIINGQSGELQGERPYSSTKITLTILIGIFFVLLLIMLFSSY